MRYAEVYIEWDQDDDKINVDDIDAVRTIRLGMSTNDSSGVPPSIYVTDTQDPEDALSRRDIMIHFADFNCGPCNRLKASMSELGIEVGGDSGHHVMSDGTRVSWDFGNKTVREYPTILVDQQRVGATALIDALSPVR